MKVPDRGLWLLHHYGVKVTDKEYLGIKLTDGLFDEAKATILRKELKHSSFSRSFTLGSELDGDKIKANFKDGLLSVEIPKLKPVEPKVTHL